MLLSWHEHLAGLGCFGPVSIRFTYSIQQPPISVDVFHFKLFGSSHRPRG